MNRSDRDDSDAASLKARAIALLARREYSRAELRDKLARRREIDASTLEALLDELVAAGYLSNARYADGFVRRKATGFSRLAIGSALKARGLDAATVSEALATTPIDDDNALRALWLRRFGKPPANDREKARQVRFLQSRGFSLSAILKLLREPPDADVA
jgi:regulatory protein